MSKRATTRVDPRTHQFTQVSDEVKWYDHIFVAPQVSLSVFGIHIVPVQRKNRALSLMWRSLLTIVVASLLIVFLTENIIAVSWGLNAWRHIKWLTSSATALFTFFYIRIRITKVRQLVDFYTINYNSWRSTEKRSIRLNISYMIPLLWCVVLAAGIDFAAYARSDYVEYFLVLKMHRDTPHVEILETVESLVRMTVIHGCINFVAFLYGTLLGMIIGNIGHLNMWMRSQEVSELEDNASTTSLTQLRNLFHHQELNLREVDSVFSPVLAIWYLMCIINVIADIHMSFEGSFPGSHAGRIAFNLFMDGFPWWAIIWATTGAAEGIQNEYHNFVQQMEQTLLALGAKNPQAPVTRPVLSVLVLLQRTSIVFPRITLAGWITVRRRLLLHLISFFSVYIAILSMRRKS
ncbi:uncharacterized protein LOC114828242 [Galendromus occidentalis]|uniref:Uncharacterized protein LOC114828242 n=1 Tax=Galendromus occidentalis TaxID=34638 RepID=A0AAJ7SG00_9ACAR|nr:uncharacterized protein LOC114828242 [Galendromus occidentalis]